MKQFELETDDPLSIAICRRDDFPLGNSRNLGPVCALEGRGGVFSHRSLVPVYGWWGSRDVDNSISPEQEKLATLRD